jgi:hypothetical protein
MPALRVDDDEDTASGHSGPRPSFFVRIVVQLIEPVYIIEGFTSFVK